MTDAQVEDHLDERQELEQERDYYKDRCTELKRQLDIANKKLKRIEDTYFRNN